MAEIKYLGTDHQGLDSIEPLWKKLNDEHEPVLSDLSSSFFKFLKGFIYYVFLALV